MTSPTVGILLLLLHSAYGESGSTPDGQEEDMETDIEYECFSNIKVIGKSTLTCLFTGLNDEHSNLTFTVRLNSQKTYTMDKIRKRKYVFHSENLSYINPCEVCVLSMEKKEQCKTYKLYLIAKPDAPINLQITYQKEAKEYIITFETVTTGYTQEKLLHKIALREENGTWKYLEDIRSQRFHVLEQNLTEDAKYEVKVQSKPNGEYFNGHWSNWSKSVYFRTSRREKSAGRSQMLIIPILCVVGFLLLATIIVLLLWKNRIKPYVWPHIPDHKSALEQLCKKQKKNLDISFNPDYFVDLHIHKVDGIQAKTQEDGLLDPMDTDLAGEDTTGSDRKIKHGCMSENALLPAMFRGIQKAGSLNGNLCDDNRDANSYALEGSDTPGHRGSRANVIQLYDGPSDHINTSDGTRALVGHVRLEGGHPNTILAVQLNNEVKALRQEEAYVTMSAFPTTSIPQER